MLWLPSPAYFTCLGELPCFQKHADARGFKVTVYRKKQRCILAPREVEYFSDRPESVSRSAITSFIGRDPEDEPNFDSAAFV